MPTRNTELLKKLIFTKLSIDSGLTSLLGASDRVRHMSPWQKVAPYPCIIYNIISEDTDPYGENISAGLAKSTLELQLFSNTTSKLLDDIEDRIYSLFHGQKISDSDILIYTIFRESKTPLYEEENQVYRLVVRYSITNVLK